MSYLWTGSDVQTTYHILQRCPSTSDVWGDCYRNIQKSSSGGEHFLHILCELLEILENEEIELMATIARRISRSSLWGN